MHTKRVVKKKNKKIIQGRRRAETYKKCSDLTNCTDKMGQIKFSLYFIFLYFANNLYGKIGQIG
jgi:hypothetical protein